MAYDGSKFLWQNRQVRSKRLCIGEVRYAPGGSCGPRVQRDYQLLFLHSGDLTVEVDACRQTLGAGCVALFLPGHREHFRFSVTSETHHSWCAATARLLPTALRRALQRAPFSTPYSATLGHLLAAGLAMGPIRGAESVVSLERLGLLLFSEYLNTAQTHLETNDCVVRRAVRFLAEHFAEPDVLEQARRAAGVSRNTLLAHFQRELKTTPARHLWRLRTERGMQMLAETGLSVAEIAFRCGFQDPFHFSRLVKRHQGISPREVRRRAWSRV